MTYYEDSRPLDLAEALGLLGTTTPAPVISKFFEQFSNNKIFLGIAVGVGVGVAVLTFIALDRSRPLRMENNLLKIENGQLKEKIQSMEQLVKTLNAKMEGLETRLETAGLLCVICQDQTLNSTFVPCGHAVCDICASKVKRCPFCNRSVEQIIARY